VIGAVQRDHAASDDRALHAELADDRTVAVISAQLGRPARGRPAVVHACGHGLPTVVRVDPRLEDGTPFPTTFWLACPLLRSAVGRLEAGGEMVQLNERLAAEPDLQAEYELTAQRYVALRDRLGEPAAPLEGAPTAGGMPRRVKCLHVHLAHHLATGDNPVGASVADALLPMSCPAPCVDVEAVGGTPPGGEAPPGEVAP
jgi:uncharacterized protein